MGVYLAMTQLELQHCPKPPPCGWMACHFSSADTGLSNIPTALPTKSLLCVDDSLLPQGHDPVRIGEQVLALYEKFSLNGVILDFQRPYEDALKDIAAAIQKVLPCSTAVTPPYVKDWDGAVFLPPVPVCRPAADYFAPWAGREIFLELSCDRLSMTLTETGCTCLPAEHDPTEPVFQDNTLYCHYGTKLKKDAVLFTLARTWEDNLRLTEDSRQYGVIHGIGLYQQIGSICPPVDINWDRPKYKEAGYE